jgi:hypothetical protein
VSPDGRASRSFPSLAAQSGEFTLIVFGLLHLGRSRARGPSRAVPFFGNPVRPRGCRSERPQTWQRSSISRRLIGLCGRLKMGEFAILGFTASSDRGALLSHSLQFPVSVVATRRHATPGSYAPNLRQTSLQIDRNTKNIAAQSHSQSSWLRQLRYFDYRRALSPNHQTMFNVLAHAQEELSPTNESPPGSHLG